MWKKWKKKKPQVLRFLEALAHLRGGERLPEPTAHPAALARAIATGGVVDLGRQDNLATLRVEGPDLLGQRGGAVGHHGRVGRCRSWRGREPLGDAAGLRARGFGELRAADDDRRGTDLGEHADAHGVLLFVAGRGLS